MFRLFQALFGQSCDLSIGVYGELVERKDPRFEDVTTYDSTKVFSVFKEDPEEMAKSFRNHNCVIFDSSETERLYSKSFYLYANGVMQVLNIDQLQSSVNSRKAAFDQNKSLTEIANSKPGVSVDLVETGWLVTCGASEHIQIGPSFTRK